MWCIKICEAHKIDTAITRRERGTYHIKFAREEGCAAVLCLALVGRMILKKLTLSL
jgi:hypothetical protein